MNAITDELIDMICDLYGDSYDDREEDSSIGGTDWLPGKKAGHKSLGAFKKELAGQGIHLSTGKIRKILITGGLYSSARSREVEEEYKKCGEDVDRVSRHLNISPATVAIYLPYQRTAYNLENKTSNAKRIDRWRGRHLVDGD